MRAMDGVCGNAGREVVRPIGIKCRDRPRDRGQPVEDTGLSAPVVDDPEAGYADRKPKFVQWIPDIPKTTVLFLNRLGQVILIVMGIQVFYQAQVHRILLKPLQFLSRLDKYVYVVFTRTGFGVGIGTGRSPMQYERNLGLPVLLVLSGLVVFLALYVSDDTPLYWVAYPFLQLWKAFTTWGGIRWEVVSIIWTLIKSILLFIWTFLSLALIITAITIPAKTLLVTARLLTARFSRSIYRTALVLMFVAGAGLVLVTT